MSWFFEPLNPFGYDVVVVDPPTTFDLYSDKGSEKSAGAHYDLMSWDELERLPVGHLARANAVLLLWACAPTLPKSLRLMEAWGARYKTELVWRKVTRSGKPRMGTGYRARTMHESVLVGVFGDERQIHDAFPSVFDGVARAHSQKPIEFYKMVQFKTAGMDRCDLFARERHSGFDGWGNEYAGAQAA